MSTYAFGRASVHPQRQLMSEEFVESCGAILFNLSDPQDLKVCLVRFQRTGEWLIAKGRRNLGESRQAAALREVTEETGYRCHMFPVTMATRATPLDAPAAGYPCKPRIFDNLTEPFACQIREMKGRTKMIWWYIAALDEVDDNAKRLPGEADFEPVFLPVAEAVTIATYQGDRALLSKAIRLVTATLVKAGAMDDTAPQGDSLKNVFPQQAKDVKRPKKRKSRTLEQQLARIEKSKAYKARRDARRTAMKHTA